MFGSEASSIKSSDASSGSSTRLWSASPFPPMTVKAVLRCAIGAIRLAGEGRRS